MVTIKEVAKRAQVSISTVSKVLSNTPYVSDSTRERILKAIDELGYIPSLAGRALSKGQTFNIGVMFAINYDRLFSDPYILTILEGIETVTTENDYSILLCTPRTPINQSRQFQRVINSGYLDGVISLEVIPSDPIASSIPNNLCPVVAIGYNPLTSRTNSVYADDYIGAKAVADYVLAMGHRKLGIIGVERSAESSFDQRIGGIQAAIRAANLDFATIPQVEGTFSIESGFEACGELFSRDPLLTAILAYNDRMAMGAIEYLHSVGKRVPRDVSVTGFDDIPSAAHFYPPLTTVHQPAYEMGIKATQLLLDLIAAGSSREQFQTVSAVIFPTELVIRDSVLKLI